MPGRGRVPAVPSPCAPRRYDDYDYAEVNHLLERMLKVYIKTVTCYPEKTNPEMFDRFWKQFKHSEKVGQQPLPPTGCGWAGSEQGPRAGVLGGAQEKPNHTKGGENGNLPSVPSCTQQGVGTVATSSTGSSEVVTPIRERLRVSPWPGRSGGCCGWQGPCWCWGPPQPAG